MIVPYALVKWGQLACTVIAECLAQVSRNPTYSYLRFSPVNNSWKLVAVVDASTTNGRRVFSFTIRTITSTSASFWSSIAFTCGREPKTSGAATVRTWGSVMLTNQILDCKKGCISSMNPLLYSSWTWSGCGLSSPGNNIAAWWQKTSARRPLAATESGTCPGGDGEWFSNRTAAGWSDGDGSRLNILWTGATPFSGKPFAFVDTCSWLLRVISRTYCANWWTISYFRRGKSARISLLGRVNGAGW